jgi:hypothetical protein
MGYGQATGGGSDESSILTRESWQSIVDRGGGKGVWTLTKRSNGTVTIAGEWTYLNSTTCPFTGGKVILSGSSVSFTATGTATNPSLPSGYRDSPFTLEVKGELKDGKGNGTYTISFSVPAWPSGFSGEWTATRTGGRDITE